MKKLVSLLLALMMCVSLAACGGPDKQPAIDAYNKAAAAFNEVADILNADPETYADYISEMNRLSGELNQVGEALQNDNDIKQETLDQWLKVCTEVEQWATAAKAELEG